jgi:hypothetical protein
MRIGMNPYKFVAEVAQPKDVTAAVLVHFPFLSGYYAQGLDVLRLCLESLIRHSDAPFDLMVFDNGSCREVRDYLGSLAQAGKIQYLIFSDRNVGKNGAWNFIFGAAPGKFIAYCDSDVYFHPNWLSKHLELFERFPRVGTVTGFAHRRSPSYSDRTLQLARATPEITLRSGRLIPQTQIDEFVTSLGKDPAQYAAKTADIQDAQVETAGVTAYISAGHFQFMIPAALARQFLPLPSHRPVGADTHLFDEAVEKSDHLRLATTQVVAQHLGNTLGPAWRQHLADWDHAIGQNPARPEQPAQSALTNLLRRQPIRKAALRISHRVMDLCNKVMMFYHDR